MNWHREADCAPFHTMKFLILAVVVAAAAALPGNWPGFPRKRAADETRDTVANMNNYTDSVLDQVKIFMGKNGYEPMPLTDKYVLNFPITDLIGLTWNTRMGLYDGEISSLTTIHRSGDATLSYTSDLRTMKMEVEVVFDRINAGYHWAAQLLSMGPNGKFTAIIKNLKAELDMSINLRTLKVTLDKFKLSEAKSIKVDVKGLTLLGDWAVEAFVNTFTTLLKGPILKVVEGKVTEAMQAGINSVDASQFLTAQTS